jgi:hypothetical protein
MARDTAGIAPHSGEVSEAESRSFFLGVLCILRGEVLSPASASIA